jgi:hypothetical protein
MRDKVATVVECIGIGLVVIGVASFSVPVGLIAAGAALILIGERA